MFDLEFDIKMKAQLQYMQVCEKRKQRKGVWQALKHDYLWTPTSTYYIGAIALFLAMKRKAGLHYWQVVPFMFVPITADYLKREYYVSQVDPEERAELEKSRKVVQSIIGEKKAHVTNE